MVLICLRVPQEAQRMQLRIMVHVYGYTCLAALLWLFVIKEKQQYYSHNILICVGECFSEGLPETLSHCFQSGSRTD